MLKHKGSSSQPAAGEASAEPASAAGLKKALEVEAGEMSDRPAYSGGRFNYVIRGRRRKTVSDIYYHLLDISWLHLLFNAFVGYLVINTVFTLLYFVGGNPMSNARAGSWADAFFFSVQTFSTIGYGAMSPTTPYAHTIVTVESFAGMVAVALGAGIIFAKFSRPAARVVFSKQMVVHERNGIPTLQFRIASERRNPISGAVMRMEMLVEEETAEGQIMRRFHSLPLEREYAPLFTMTWTGIHRLDEHSPLRAIKLSNDWDRLMFILVTFEGNDSTTLQTVLAQQVYLPSQIAFGYAFEDIILTEPDGRISLQLNRLDAVKPAGRA